MLEGMKPQRSKAVYCRIEQLTNTLSESDRDIFVTAIDDVVNWGSRTLSNELRARGLSVADTTITKHRKRACACYRD
jgi:hypothetical protein